ncbi:hypothetical protein SEA_SHROOMS_95 [Arthrobacter phage Shrooms]|nr:hypothetical protein SEA_SHROOMS_95 [Arthrobacter phage Shrooms]
MPSTANLALRRAEYEAGVKKRKAHFVRAIDNWRGKEADEYEESEKIIQLVIDEFNESWTKDRLSLKKHGRKIFHVLTISDHLKRIQPVGPCECACVPCESEEDHTACTGDDYGDTCHDGTRPLPVHYRKKTPEDMGGPNCGPFHRPAVEYWRGYWTQERTALIAEITAYKEPRP